MSDEWTTVGRKRAPRALANITPSDIYYDNIRKAPPSENPSSSVAHTLSENISGMSQLEKLKYFEQIVTFSLSEMSSIVNNFKASKELDDQSKVIELCANIEPAIAVREKIGCAMTVYDASISSIQSKKNVILERIRNFLKSCDIVGESTVQDINSNCKKSYASSIGSTISNLVIEREIPKSPNRPIMAPVSIGGVNISMPTISDGYIDAQHTHYYIKSKNVFAINIGGAVFTTGDCTYINIKNTEGKTKNAKRCLNPQPCTFKYCNYYHDPCIVTNGFTKCRNFALSYVLQLLSAIKNHDDLMENKFIRDPGVLKDIVQLGGSILLKAAQIKALHFPNTKM
jgi:hypothetical protein